MTISLQLYTGFWKLKIESHFFNIIPLFERMGYRPCPEDGTLQLQQPASRDTLIEVNNKLSMIRVSSIIIPVSVSRVSGHYKLHVCYEMGDAG